MKQKVSTTNDKAAPRGSRLTVYYDRTLIYYDGPQVFEACSALPYRRNSYIGMAVTLPNGKDSYLLKAASMLDISAFSRSDIDLRSLLLIKPKAAWYLTYEEVDFEQPLKLEKQNSSLIESDYLPEAGIFSD